MQREAVQQVTTDSFQRVIREAMEAETARIIEEEIAKAKDAVESRLMGMKSEFAQRVLKRVTFRTENLLGRVQLIVEL